MWVSIIKEANKMSPHYKAIALGVTGTACICHTVLRLWNQFNICTEKKIRVITSKWYWICFKVCTTCHIINLYLFLIEKQTAFRLRWITLNLRDDRFIFKIRMNYLNFNALYQNEKSNQCMATMKLSMHKSWNGVKKL